MKIYTCGVTIDKVDLLTEYTYQPLELDTNTPEQTEVQNITFDNGIEVPDLMVTDDLISQIESQCLAYHRINYNSKARRCA